MTPFHYKKEIIAKLNYMFWSRRGLALRRKNKYEKMFRKKWDLIRMYYAAYKAVTTSPSTRMPAIASLDI